ncbi:MAG: hypothetical protein WA421_05565, partial [Nitrososphaeraceae archaeon]
YVWLSCRLAAGNVTTVKTPAAEKIGDSVVKSTSILPLFTAVTGFDLLVTSYTYSKFIAS